VKWITVVNIVYVAVSEFNAVSRVWIFILATTAGSGFMVDKDSFTITQDLVAYITGP